MISNNYENAFEEGRWVSKLEAAMLFNVTERTIENRIKSEALKSRTGEDGKTEILVRKSSKPSNIFEIERNDPIPDDPSLKSSSKSFEGLTQENDELKTQLKNIEAELMKIKLEHAQLIGESKGKDKLIEEKERLISSKDDVIKAKDQALNAANAAVMLLENQKLPAIETREGNQNPGSSSSESKKGWFDKFLGR